MLSPQSLRVIEGEGMPRTSSAFNREDYLLTAKQMPKGDLYVRFDIVFPTNLGKTARDSIVGALKQNELEI